MCVLTAETLVAKPAFEWDAPRYSILAATHSKQQYNAAATVRRHDDATPLLPPWR